MGSRHSRSLKGNTLLEEKDITIICLLKERTYQVKTNKSTCPTKTLELCLSGHPEFGYDMLDTLCCQCRYGLGYSQILGLTTFSNARSVICIGHQLFYLKNEQGKKVTHTERGKIYELCLYCDHSTARLGGAPIDQ